jgi:ABC-2 type transport system ATP-binding protein
MIKVHQLTKRYGNAIAVDGLSFTIRPGRVTGFLGPNGAGKSTTMRVILGLDAPTSGWATVNGQPYQRLTRPLYQAAALLDPGAVHGGRTARNHLRAIAASNGIGARRVDQVLPLVGLDSAARRRVRGFSLGMKQRLGIAAALLGDPPVLMLDEPVNGLDPEGIHWIRGLLRSLAAEGRTVFVSSHLMSEMAPTADHLIVISRGRLIANAPIDEFVRHSSRSNVIVRSPADGALAALLTQRGAAVTAESDGRLAVTGLDAAAIGDLAREHDIALHELTPRHASLEEVFMNSPRTASTTTPACPQAHRRPPDHDRHRHHHRHRLGYGTGPRHTRLRVDQAPLGSLHLPDPAVRRGGGRRHRLPGDPRPRHPLGHHDRPVQGSLRPGGRQLHRPGPRPAGVRGARRARDQLRIHHRPDPHHLRRGAARSSPPRPPSSAPSPWPPGN